MSLHVESRAPPCLALLGAGTFVKDQYVTILRDMAGAIAVRYVWSRSKEAADEVAVLVAPLSRAAVEAVHGEEGLRRILEDEQVHAVAVVLPALAQPGVVMRALQARKHVLQEKPVGATMEAAHPILALHRSLAGSSDNGGRLPPIWAVAENYRFEPGLAKAAEMVRGLGRLMVVEVVVEAPMAASNPYFNSQWRRDPEFVGAFLVDGGVHFIAGLRLIVGSEVTKVAAITTHRNDGLPAPDNLSAVMAFDNGCSGVLAMSYSSTSRKVSWRVVGAGGTVEAERGVHEGKHGYWATLLPQGGAPERSFFAFDGVQGELRAFAADVAAAAAAASLGELFQADERSSPVEAMRDLAVVEAMIRSGAAGGALTEVARVAV